jgi:hypothetical protein
MAASPRSVAPPPATRGGTSGRADAGKKRSSKRTDAPREAPRAAALIVAHNQARRIASTVRAARAIPGIDLVLVVDDGSTDNTQDLARKAGAVVVRHSHYRGRTVSMETGASVIAMRDDPAREPRAVLMLQGSLGNYAIGAAPLVQAVTEHVADMAIALTDTRRRSPGVAATLARRAVDKTANWVPEQPLSRIRCLTREALEAAMPLARGAGLDVGMTLDVLQAGFTVTEVDCEIRHKANTGADRSAARRATQYRDVMVAVGARRLRAGFESTRTAVSNRLRRDHTEEN